MSNQSPAAFARASSSRTRRICSCERRPSSVRAAGNTLAVGIFGGADFSLLTQAIGVLSYGLVAFPVALGIFAALKYSPLGLRVSETEEIGGLDVGEHGMEAYSGFQIFTTQ